MKDNTNRFVETEADKYIKPLTKEQLAELAKAKVLVNGN